MNIHIKILREAKMNDVKLEEALAKNNEDWAKRMLLLVMIMMIAVLGLD